MLIENRTDLDTRLLQRMFRRAIEGHGRPRHLRVEIAWARPNCRQAWTGVFRAGDSKGPRIRVSLNRSNDYPLREPFGSGIYLERRKFIIDGAEWHYWRQLLYDVVCSSAEELALVGFLHEYAHYLDYSSRRRTRYRQTAADKFALAILRERFPEIRIEKNADA